MARLSTEAEYRALANFIAELILLQALLKELGNFLPQPLILWCDNIGASYLSVNPIFLARTIHVTHRKLDVRFISSKDQPPDVLTKPLVALKFSPLQDKLTLCLPPLS